MTAPAVSGRRADAQAANPGPSAGASQSLAVSGVVVASAVTGVGLVVLIPLVLAGWIAAPHTSVGLPAMLRTAAALWLVGQHVGFALRGTGRIGLLPLGLVLLPGALLWRAGRWMVKSGSVRELRQVGFAALALAGPYALLTGGLALASKSAQVSASVPQAFVCGFLLALVAGGLGAARALAPWRNLMQLLPDRTRAVVIAVTGSLGVLAAAGALLIAVALSAHLHEAASLQRSLGAGVIGTLLLFMLQVAYVPNAVAWAIAFAVGPGFAVGNGTVVASTGSALGRLPAFPMLAAIPTGVHQSMPTWLTPAVMALPYVAGIVGGCLLIRTAQAAITSIETAALLGMASGLLTGALLGLLAGFAGGSLGNGRLAAIGPSGWQVGLLAGLELGIASAVTAGIGTYFKVRGSAHTATHLDGGDSKTAPTSAAADAGHVRYINPWAGEENGSQPRSSAGPAALP